MKFIFLFLFIYIIGTSSYKIPIYKKYKDDYVIRHLGLGSSKEAFIYYANVGIGNPPQFSNVMLDTSGGDFWISGNNIGNISHNIFNKTDSNTFVNLNKSFNIYTDSGMVQGIWGRDNLLINNNILNNVSIGVVDYKEPGINNLFEDGILGLGYNMLATNPDNITLIDYLKKKNIYTFSLLFKKMGGYSPQFEIGYINQNLINGDYKYYINKPYSYWSITIGKFKIGRWYYSNNIYEEAIIDTSSSIISIPKNQYNNVLSHIINGMESCKFDHTLNMYKCTDLLECIELPTFSIFLKNINTYLDEYIIDTYTLENSDSCIILLESNNSTKWILGTMFLENYYTIFDFQENTVNFNSNQPYIYFMNILLILIIIFSVILLFATIIHVTIMYIKRKNQWKKSKKFNSELEIEYEKL